jgi:hypothetical protein
MKWELNLLMFDDPATYTVTVLNDGNFSATTASPASGAKNTTVTLTITPSTGKELAEIEVVAGGVTVDPDDLTFKIGEANVTLYVKGKANNKYLVTEECSVCINEARTVFHKNAIVQLTANGVPKAVVAEDGGTSITSNDGVQYLIDQGVLVKI